MRGCRLFEGHATNQVQVCTQVLKCVCHVDPLRACKCTSRGKLVIISGFHQMPTPRQHYDWFPKSQCFKNGPCARMPNDHISRQDLSLECTWVQVTCPTHV